MTPSTGDIVQGFPHTPSHLDQMPAAELNPVLMALELMTTGTMRARRDRLRLAIGLRIGAE